MEKIFYYKKNAKHYIGALSIKLLNLKVTLHYITFLLGLSASLLAGGTRFPGPRVTVLLTLLNNPLSWRVCNSSLHVIAIWFPKVAMQVLKPDFKMFE